MIKDIFVPLLGLPSDETALDSAISLATAHGASVTAAVAVDIPAPFFSEVGFAANEVTTQAYNQARAEAEQVATKARQRLTLAHVDADVRIIEPTLGRPRGMATQARYSDLSIMGGRTAGDMPAVAATTFESLLMQSGRPVIVVPHGATLPAKLQHVVLAWQPSREATRAVHDAVPLLDPHSRVDLLIIDPDKSQDEDEPSPGARIADKLAHMGLPVRIVAREKTAATEGESLLQYFQESEAELLVMGGYGHSRLRELILGGTTRTVLDGLTKPVFFEH